MKPYREGIVVAYQQMENKNPTEEQIKAQMGQPDMRNVYESLLDECEAYWRSLLAQIQENPADYTQIGMIDGQPVYKKG